MQSSTSTQGPHGCIRTSGWAEPRHSRTEWSFLGPAALSWLLSISIASSLAPVAMRTSSSGSASPATTPAREIRNPGCVSTTRKQHTHAGCRRCRGRAARASTGAKGGLRRRRSGSWTGSVRNRLGRAPEDGCWLQGEGGEIQPEDGSRRVWVSRHRSRQQVHVDAEEGVNERDSRRGPLWHWPIARLVVRMGEVLLEHLLLILRHRECFVG